MLKFVRLLLEDTHELLIDSLHTLLPLPDVLHLFLQKLNLLLVKSFLLVMLALLISELLFQLAQRLTLIGGRSFRSRLDRGVQVALLPETCVVQVTLERPRSLMVLVRHLHNIGQALIGVLILVLMHPLRRAQLKRTNLRLVQLLKIQVVRPILRRTIPSIRTSILHLFIKIVNLVNLPLTQEQVLLHRLARLTRMLLDPTRDLLELVILDHLLLDRLADLDLPHIFLKAPHGCLEANPGIRIVR